MSYTLQKTSPYEIYQNYNEKVDHACNLFHSNYIEHLRNNSPKKQMIKDYSEILDLEKKNMKNVMGRLLAGNQEPIPIYKNQTQNENLQSPIQKIMRQSEMNNYPENLNLNEKSTKNSGYHESLKEYLDNNELKSQIIDLKKSISNLEKENRHSSPQLDRSHSNYKSEIFKLNKEILSLQATIQNMNSKMIANGLLNPEKAQKYEYNNSRDPNEANIIMSNYAEIELSKQFKEFMNNIYSNPDKFQSIFNKNFVNKDILTDLLINKNYNVLLLNILQMFNDFIKNETAISDAKLLKSDHLCSPNRMTEVPTLTEFETKPIDFKSYFNTNETPQRNKPNHNFSKFYSNTRKKDNEEIIQKTESSNKNNSFKNKKVFGNSPNCSSSRDFKKRGFFNPDDDKKSINENRHYNNRSSERFPLNDDVLNNVDLIDIDETTHKKKQLNSKLKLRKFNIINNDKINN